MKNAWKIDYDKRIIYIFREVDNSNLLSLFTELNNNDKGLSEGPLIKWRIMIVQQ